MIVAKRNALTRVAFTQRIRNHDVSPYPRGYQGEKSHAMGNVARVWSDAHKTEQRVQFQPLPLPKGF